jgi:hypothetical protein
VIYTYRACSHIHRPNLSTTFSLDVHTQTCKHTCPHKSMLSCLAGAPALYNPHNPDIPNKGLYKPRPDPCGTDVLPDSLAACPAPAETCTTRSDSFARSPPSPPLFVERLQSRVHTARLGLRRHCRQQHRRRSAEHLIKGYVGSCLARPVSR